MKKTLITALAIFTSGCASQGQMDQRVPSSSKTSGSFNCSNAPAVKWGTYYCVNASFKNSKNLHGILFGTCEGSSKAEEEEPVDQVEIASLQHDDSLAGSSAEWKDASAFDVSTKEHGKATLLIKPGVFQPSKGERVEARLKITVDGQKKDIRLTCGSSLD